MAQSSNDKINIQLSEYFQNEVQNILNELRVDLEKFDTEASTSDIISELTINLLEIKQLALIHNRSNLESVVSQSIKSLERFVLTPSVTPTFFDNIRIIIGFIESCSKDSSKITSVEDIESLFIDFKENPTIIETKSPIELVE